MSLEARQRQTRARMEVTLISDNSIKIQNLKSEIQLQEVKREMTKYTDAQVRSVHTGSFGRENSQRSGNAFAEGCTKTGQWEKLAAIAITLLLVAAGCSSKATPLPPTQPPPTATQAPPTATQPPPTATQAPPTATQPAPTSTPTPLPPTATPTPVKVVASTIEDLVGIWRIILDGEPAYVQFDEDGTLIFTEEAMGKSPLVHGKIWFEGTVLNFKDSSCDDTGTYEAWVVKAGDRPIRLILTVMSDPTCPARVRTLKMGMHWVQP